MRTRELLLISFLLVFTLTQVGCASFNRKLKNFLGGNSEEEAKKTSTLTKFSETGDVAPRVNRAYKRTTKESLSNESALDSKAGSLWVMEGQGAYLFSQNVVRLIGDPLAVTLEGDPREQLQSKVNVIKKLLNKIEERQKARVRNPAGGEGEAEESASAEEKGKSAKKGQKAGDTNQAAQQAPQKEDVADFNVKNVPTRIVERTLEGNYRVKGSQAVMIGTREYKIIVTGIVRAEDFNDDGISAGKLLDPKFDIVSARRKEGEM
jgi:flagellar L-ring protein precursor FlgH